MSATFSVKNFEQFQHYKDRSPPWIRLYNALLDDYAFGQLPDASKAHLVAIWLLASRYENKIPYDPEWIARRINATSPVDLEALSKAGFIIVSQGCSTLLAERKQSAMPEERRGETEKSSEPNGSGGAAAEARPSESLPPEEPIDDRTWLFTIGLPWLSEASGKPVPGLRPLMGRWLKLAGDDGGALRRVIERCRGSPVADPISFIEANLKPKTANGKRPAHDVFEAALAAEVAGNGYRPGEWPPDPSGGFGPDERTIDLAEGSYRRSDPPAVAGKRH